MRIFFNFCNYHSSHRVFDSRCLKMLFSFIVKFSCHCSSSLCILGHYAFNNIEKSTMGCIFYFFFRGEESFFSSSKSNTFLCLSHSWSRFRSWSTSQNPVLLIVNCCFTHNSVCLFNDLSFQCFNSFILKISSFSCWFLLMFLLMCVSLMQEISLSLIQHSSCLTKKFKAFIT